jgi:TRAP-type transport system periplasmic protein
MKLLTSISLAAMAAALIATPLPAQAQTSWTVYTYTPAATLAPARGLNRIAEGVGADGLKLNIHLGGALPIGASDIANALSDNVIQLGDDGFFQGNLPVTGILRLPMLVANDAEFEKAKEVMRPYFERAYEKKGALMLGHYNYPLQVVWSRKPINSLADIKGQKLRVTSPEQAEFVKRLGGVGVTIGAAEVPSALDRGVVDGVFTASSGGGKIWRDLLKYNYRLGPNYFDGVIAVNKTAFEKLPAATQAKLRQSVTETAPWITTQLRGEEDEATQMLAKGGITVVAAKPDDISSAAKLMAPYWDEWAKAKGPEAVEALGKVRAALGR